MEQYLQLYEEMFDDSFPTFPFMGRGDSGMIEIIKRCLEKEQDVYDLGILTLDGNIKY